MNNFFTLFIAGLSIISGLYIFISKKQFGNLSSKFNKPIGIIGIFLGTLLAISLVFGL